ncbi:hypothetical protein CFC35_10020 [Streptomyces sp. FBKL.4005]|nr:hypothetical protein CFC35_10020 [Streptomyces sp. FBKL.4005]
MKWWSADSCRRCDHGPGREGAPELWRTTPRRGTPRQSRACGHRAPPLGRHRPTTRRRGLAHDRPQTRRRPDSQFRRHRLPPGLRHRAVPQEPGPPADEGLIHAARCDVRTTLADRRAELNDDVDELRAPCRFVFRDPRATRMYPERERMARDGVGVLRSEVAKNPRA